MTGSATDGLPECQAVVFFFRAMEREPTLAPAFFVSLSASVSSHNKLNVLANNTPQMRLPRELGKASS
jgi:hypothetical protein